MPAARLLPAVAALLALAAASHAEPASLIDWVRQQGGYVHPAIEIAHFPKARGGGRGLRCKQALSGRTLLLSVPQAACISLSTARAAASPPLQAAIDLLASRAGSAEALALFLAAPQQLRSGQFQPVIDAQPKLAMTSLQLSPMERAALKGSTTERRAFALEQRLQQAVRLLAEGAPELVQAHGIDEQRMRWALSVIISRVFDVDLRSAADRQASEAAALLSGEAEDTAAALTRLLLPVGDMANHHSTAQSSVRGNSGNKSVELFTISGCEEGKQLLINYGPKSNIDLLVQYGFTQRRNSADKLTLPMLLPKNDPLRQRKLALIQQHAPSAVGEVTLTLDGITAGSRRALALLALSEQQLTADGLAAVLDERSLGADHEHRMAEHLMTLCLEALRPLPRLTLQQELEALASPAISDAMRAVLTARSLEKRILISCLQKVTGRRAS